MYTILNDVISLLQTEPAVNVLKLFFNPNVVKLLPTEHVLQLIEKTRYYFDVFHDETCISQNKEFFGLIDEMDIFERSVCKFINTSYAQVIPTIIALYGPHLTGKQLFAENIIPIMMCKHGVQIRIYRNMSELSKLTALYRTIEQQITVDNTIYHIVICKDSMVPYIPTTLSGHHILTIFTTTTERYLKDAELVIPFLLPTEEVALSIFTSEYMRHVGNIDIPTYVINKLKEYIWIPSAQNANSIHYAHGEFKRLAQLYVHNLIN